jgi:hypothetical protein
LFCASIISTTTSSETDGAQRVRPSELSSFSSIRERRATRRFERAKSALPD